MNDQQIEAKIQEKGLTKAPRLTPAYIDSRIKTVEYMVLQGRITVCVMTLQNDFVVIGESAATSAENFDKELGEEMAFDEARERIWELEGYLLKERIYQAAIANGQLTQ